MSRRSFTARWRALLALVALIAFTFAGAETPYNPAMRTPTPGVQSVVFAVGYDVNVTMTTTNNAYAVATKDLPLNTYVISVIPTGVPVISPRGRYYIVSAIFGSKSLITTEGIPLQNVWSGYPTSGSIASFPNIRVAQGMVLTLTVWSGTNGAISGTAGVRAWCAETQISQGAFPYAEIPGSGQGEIISFGLGAPAAGSDYPTKAVPPLVRWRYRSLQGDLTTGVAVANRVPQMIFDDGVTVYAEIAMGTYQVASLTCTYTWYYLGGFNITNKTVLLTGDAAVAGLGDVIQPAGHRWAGETVGIAAADQWSAGRFVVEEWVFPQP